MRRFFTVALAMGLVAAWAWPQAGAVAASQTASDLFDAARLALDQVPAGAAPREWLQLGMLERTPLPAQAAQDVSAAFEHAHALPPLDAGDADAPGWMQAKEAVERAAIGQLLALRRDDLALALTRRADGSQEPLYSELLMHAGAAAGTPDGVDHVFSLISECQARTGAFPFTGAAAVLQEKKLDTIAQSDLIRAAYRAAADPEGSPDIGDTARLFLPLAHRTAPQLDDQLETVLNALLARVANSGFPADPGTGQILMSLLGQFDPAHAAELEAEYPAMIPSGPTPVFTLLPLDEDAAAASGLTPPPPETGAENADALRFQARQLTPEAIRADPAAAAALAPWLASQGRTSQDQPSDVETLLAACLAAAVEDAAQLESDYANASVAQRQQWMNTRAEAVVEVFQRVAILDFALARRSAENLRSPLLKPLVLAQLAAAVPKPSPAR